VPSAICHVCLCGVCVCGGGVLPPSPLCVLPALLASGPVIEKLNCTVMYVDADGKHLVVADENYDEVHIPIQLCAGAEKYCEAGTPVGVLKCEDDFVKLQFPSQVLSAVRKGGK